jgi:hypothetical protein
LQIVNVPDEHAGFNAANSAAAAWLEQAGKTHRVAGPICAGVS